MPKRPFYTVKYTKIKWSGYDGDAVLGSTVQQHRPLIGCRQFAHLIPNSHLQQTSMRSYQVLRVGLPDASALKPPQNRTLDFLIVGRASRVSQGCAQDVDGVFFSLLWWLFLTFGSGHGNKIILIHNGPSTTIMTLHPSNQMVFFIWNYTNWNIEFDHEGTIPRLSP